MADNRIDVQRKIEVALAQIEGVDFAGEAETLLGALGYRSERTLPGQPGTVDDFLSAFSADNPGTKSEGEFRKQAASVNILFQVTDSEINEAARSQLSMFANEEFDKGSVRSFMFAAVELTGERYARGQYVAFTREVNKRFSSPAVVLFRTADGLLTLSFVHVRPNKRKPERDVLGSVSLIREVKTDDPHRAHVDILAELALEERLRWMDTHGKSRDFDGLLAAWLDALDTEELNRRFYRVLKDWFDRAVEEAHFPEAGPRVLQPEEHVIRLITRLLFVWFVKEKGLVADELFIEAQVRGLLKDYDAASGDSYYRAVLQNLFFATLNTEIGRRGFSSQANATHRDFSLYRYRAEMSDPDALFALFAQTPFINGGLFDCLDSEEATGPNAYRIDYFTDNIIDPRRKGHEYRALSIPNHLFFDNTGLITLFNHYKFTVEENTPAEQEVALDPELLGKVFENLLAAYNPETRESARKQTGSYYTPRAVVDYMVDEALVASLAHKARPDGGDASWWEDRLRYLLDYNDAGELFDEAETERVVGAIAGLRVLDPAVGSGAFPMGVLHKLTLALRRLDPDNRRWEALQKAQAVAMAADAFDSGTRRDRDQALDDISETFERYRDSDFGRKLYLIQNSIYGVDIQPVATQIAKLRFFISLAIEQQPHGDSNANYGIKPLPNLETRFVAANTLLGLGEATQIPLGGQNRVTELNDQLRRNRELHFHAGVRHEKLRLRREDARLRGLLAKELAKVGMSASDGNKVAQWDPYDQNAHADWFDAGYMFDVANGFDVVIGNPPYVRADSGRQHLELRQRIEADGQYETLWEKWDLYIAFIEKGYKLLRRGGFTTMIVSDAYCHSKYAQKSQNWFLANSRIVQLDFFSKIRIFDAAVRNITYLFQKADGLEQKPIRRVHGPEFGTVTLLRTDEQRGLTHRVFFPEDPHLQEFSALTLTLKEICYISKGMVVHADEKRVPGAFALRDLVSDRKNSLHPKPFVEGKHLGRWTPTINRWLEWDTKRAPGLFSRPTFTELYNVAEKLISVDMAAGVEKLRVAYDDKQLYHNHSAWSFVLWRSLSGVRNRSIKRQARYQDEKLTNSGKLDRKLMERNSKGFKIKFLIGVMNSTAARDFLRSNRRSNIHLYPDDWKELPIPKVSLERQEPVIALVDRILAARDANAAADTRALEAEVDRLVYALYGLTEDEIAVVEGR